jgi:hypothetical protein
MAVPPRAQLSPMPFKLRKPGRGVPFGGITFIDTLPASLTYVSASVSPRSALAALACSVQGQTVTCPLNELQNGGTSGQVPSLTVVSSSTPQQIVNTASALTVLPQTALNPVNNSVTVTSK